MKDREEEYVKPTPFLTIQISRRVTGAYVRCPELGMGIGIGSRSRDEAIDGIQKAVVFSARVMAVREEFTGERKRFAKKIINELDRGAEIADLFKKTAD